MLIGVCGGLCAGKSSIQQYLISHHAFQPLSITQSPSTPPISKDSSSSGRKTPPSTQTFSTVTALLDFATQNWQQNYVTTSILSDSTAETLSHRPFFILIHVDSPLSTRWRRFQTRALANLSAGPSLEDFVLQNDAHLYSPSTNLASLASRAQIKILNTAASLEEFWTQLQGLKLTDPERLRPSWDHYFMTLADLAARRSNCMRRQVGCVLVRAHRVISTGYNGTPRHLLNCAEGGCPRCNNAASSAGGAALSTCLCLHAEENALLEAGRERIGDGAVLYCNTCPCLTCSIKIVQVGIAEVVFSRSYWMDGQAAEIFRGAGVKLRQFSSPREGLLLCGGGEGGGGGE